jgi:uncharacterized cupredoxin-like copper-binding protein
MEIDQGTRLMRKLLLAMLPFVVVGTSAMTVDAPPRIEIHLSNFKFAPRNIVLNSGQPIVLNIINDAGGGHNFAAKQFFAAARVQPRSMAQIKNGVIEIPSHQSRQILLIAPAAGRYDLKCTHFLHAGFGMKGSIIVR